MARRVAKPKTDAETRGWWDEYRDLLQSEIDTRNELDAIKGKLFSEIKLSADKSTKLTDTTAWQQIRSNERVIKALEAHQAAYVNLAVYCARHDIDQRGVGYGEWGK